MGSSNERVGDVVRCAAASLRLPRCGTESNGRHGATSARGSFVIKRSRTRL
ncbi:hypothetical protein BSLA_02f1755 [Burkholderia stabilis]|nr:hypothetical protein BSLA_02f1755 [Burkholderia stabilis]